MMGSALRLSPYNSSCLGLQVTGDLKNQGAHRAFTSHFLGKPGEA